MPGSGLRLLWAVALVVLGAAPALADDWIAEKLRGRVLKMVDGDWRVLARGDAVPDSHAIRTVGNSRVLLVRGTETVELGPNTRIEIIDRDGRQFTTVRQAFGEVKIEADVRQVEHFSVETPHLAAVVKGTVFVVRSGRSGAEVVVERGHVAVDSAQTHAHVVLAAGQSAEIEDGGALSVTGSGALPVVTGSDGRPIGVGPADGTSVPAAQLNENQLKNIAKDAEKATKEAEKAAEKATRAAEKAAEKADRAAEKAAEKADRAAEKADKSHDDHEDEDEDD